MVLEAAGLALAKDPLLWRSRFRKAKPVLLAAMEAGLRPTPYFVEGLAYWHRAKQLQDMNLGLRPKRSVGDRLQEAIPIYDTVQRRYAGFSNIPEALWYGDQAPKYKTNLARGWYQPKFEGSFLDWMYVCFVHRCTGSGASFEHDHGWRNTMVPTMAKLIHIDAMAAYASTAPAPCNTTIGNQTISVRLEPDRQGSRNHLQFYLCHDGLTVVKEVYTWLMTNGCKTIKETVDKAVEINSRLGQRRFVFVLTAWVMDIAEYAPDMVDPSSDCYHGSNARQSWERFFEGRVYDRAARFMADITGTWPMDVEDVMCDAVRWIEGYVPKKGYEHVKAQGIYSSCSLHHTEGRQA